MFWFCDSLFADMYVLIVLLSKHVNLSELRLMLLFHLLKGLVEAVSGHSRESLADKRIEEASSEEEEEDEEDNQEPEVDVTQLTGRKKKLFELKLKMVTLFFFFL